MRKVSLMTAIAVAIGISPVAVQAQFQGESNPFEQFRRNPATFSRADATARQQAEADTKKQVDAKAALGLQNYGDKLFGEATEMGVQSAEYRSESSNKTVTPVSAFGEPAEAVQEFTSNRVSLPAPTERRTVSAPQLGPATSLTDPVATTSIRPASIKDAAPTNLKAEWKTSGAFNVGQECTCSLVITNSGAGTASDVTVETHIPTSARVISAIPKPVATSTFLSWAIGAMAPNSSKTIEVVLIPSAQGEFRPTAHVRHTSTAVAGFKILEPMLSLAVAGPTEVYSGDPASQIVTITNPGTGVATNVVLEAIIPAGLEHARGGKLRTELGNLNPGETRSVRLALAAVTGGEHILQVGAKADAGLSQASTAKVSVIAPSLASSIDGPGLRYLGREAVYAISIGNDGAAATDNVRVMHKLPEGFGYVSSTRGAKFDPQTNIVSWFVGRLDRGQTIKLGLTLLAEKSGSFTHLVRATSDQGVVSDTQMTTRVEGVSALAVNVSDLDDPVEVGGDAAYAIEIKNEGSAPATNVALICELPAGTTFKNAKGPSRHAEASGKVMFQPIASIAPGQTMTYQVIASGSQAGSKLFRATISSDTVEKITSEESTRFYGE